MKELSFLSGTRTLTGRIFVPTDAGKHKRGILFIHGQGSSQASYKERAQSLVTALDLVSLTFNLSGHGEVDAGATQYSPYEHLEDVVAAFDCLASHESVDSSRIGVCGASYGGYLASLLTSCRAVNRLVLRAPSLAPDLPFASRMQRTTALGTIPDGLDSLHVLSQYRGDTLVIQSERDEVIPDSVIAAYLHASPRVQHQVIPKATHALTNPAWDKIFIQLLLKWFKDM